MLLRQQMSVFRPIQLTLRWFHPKTLYIGLLLNSAGVPGKDEYQL